MVEQVREYGHPKDYVEMNREGYVLIWMTTFLLITSILLVTVWHILLQFNRIRELNFKTIKNSYIAEGAVYRSIEFLEKNPERSLALSYNHPDGARVTVRSMPDGIFTRVYATANASRSCVGLDALLGAVGVFPPSTAIVTTDPSSPLTLGRETSVKGDIWTGTRGVRYPKNTEDLPSEVHDGNIFQAPERIWSEMDVVKLQATFMELDRLLWSVESPLSAQTEFSQTYRAFGHLQLSDHSVIPVNWNAPFHLFVDGTLEVGSTVRIPAGSVIIVSGETIFSGDVHVERAIVYSHKGITVKDDVTGSGQFLSNTWIRVAGQASLSYPTWMVVLDTGDGNLANKGIAMDEEARVDGGIIFLGQESRLAHRGATVRIGASSTIRGGIINLGSTSLSGKIFGMVITRRFLAFDDGSTRLNTVMDAEIRVTDRPHPFHWPGWIFGSSRLDVINIRKASCSPTV